MAVTILETKLFVPTRRPSLVSRPRLVQRLERTLQGKLTLVSGPPGFGKTTLLTEWLSSLPGIDSVAWLSLDESVDAPVVFWSYVIAALQRIEPALGDNESALLQSAQPPSLQEVLTMLLNTLNSIDRELVLALDDYHVIHDNEIRASMAFFLDNLPPRMHVVIASRADPLLPLARLRARGELVEVRAADLRFQHDEAAAYFKDVMDLDISEIDLGVLEGRTEGWIAALQLAALSLQGRNDVSGFIEDFAGDNRYIVDYLVEEVLQQQTEPVREFLLQTSILDRLGADLCDAVTGRTDSQAMLAYLEDANIFLIPLDDRRRWFRYHHLFADVLRARLRSEQPEHTNALHERASLWFAQNGEQDQAIRHALAAADFQRAAGLIELALPVMLKSRQDTILRAWLEAVPDEVIRLRPVLSAGYVGVLLHSGEYGAVEGRLRDAELSLAEASQVDLDGEGASQRPALWMRRSFASCPG